MPEGQSFRLAKAGPICHRPREAGVSDRPPVAVPAAGAASRKGGGRPLRGNLQPRRGLLARRGAGAAPPRGHFSLKRVRPGRNVAPAGRRRIDVREAIGVAKRPVTAQDILRIRLGANVEISPDGGLIAFEEICQDPETNETRSRIEGLRPGKPPWHLTSGTRDRQPRFSPDGTKLAFLRKAKQQTQIWILPLAGGESWQLTAVSGGVSEFAWSPDGQLLAFTTPVGAEGIEVEAGAEEKDPERRFTADVKVIEELAHKLDGEGYFKDPPCLCTIEPSPGAAPRQLTFAPYRVHDVGFAADGQAIYFLSRRGDDYDKELFDLRLYRIGLDGGEVTEVAPAGVEGFAAGPELAIAMSDPKEMGYDNTRLFLAAADGSGLRAAAPGFDRTLGNAAISDVPGSGFTGLAWAPDGQGVYGIYSDRGTTQLGVFRPDGSVEALTSGRHVVYGYSVARSGAIALLISTPTDPGNVYLLRDGALEGLTNLNEALFSEVATVEPEFFEAPSPDVGSVDTWVMKPLGLPALGKAPTVLMIHGGPMSMYAHTYFFEFQLLAAAGFGVVYTNPRGSQGYGFAFCQAIQREWGNLDLKDIYAGLDAAIEGHPFIDSERLGVGGGSYGGYMTNWIIGHTNRFKAAVSGRSVVDWQAMVGTGDGGWGWVDRAGGVPPWRDDSWYRQQSPITYVDNIVTPLLIENQEGDLRCPIEQGMILYSAVKWLRKAPVRFVRYPDEFHGMNRGGKPWHRVHRLKEIVRWYERYLPLGGA